MLRVTIMTRRISAEDIIEKAPKESESSFFIDLILTNHLKRFYSCWAQFSQIDYNEVTVMKVSFQKLKSRKLGIEKTNLSVNLKCKLGTTFTLSSLSVATFFDVSSEKLKNKLSEHVLSFSAGIFSINCQYLFYFF